MADRRKKLHRKVIGSLPREQARVGETVVPTLSVIEQMAEQRAPLPAFAPNSPAAACYERLWEEVRPT
jgi:chromosome partitioning protein